MGDCRTDAVTCGIERAGQRRRIVGAALCNAASCGVLLLVTLASITVAQEQQPAKPQPTQPPPSAPSAPPPLDGRDGRELALRLFRPKPVIKVDEHPLERAKFPVVDTHTHFRIRTRHSPEQRDAFVELMDRNNIAICVSLDGGWGDAFDEHSAYLWTKYRERFVIFANIDWRGAGRDDDPSTWDCLREDFPRRAAERLADAKRRGASGVKVFKEFGLGYKNADGTLIKVDDPRWDEIWRACGELGLPVLLHTGDPSAFFAPIDPTNERWEELSRRPAWSFADRSKFPSREELFAARNRVVARHPQTKFIAAHFGNDGEDLKTLAEWLDKHPNLHVDLASRISELGRQPYSARRFLTKYADRVLFATDGPWPEQRLRLYWRFLETYDENFPYSEKEFPPQGLWNIYGVGLDDQVLHKIYHENAANLIPGVRERLEKRGAK